MQTSWAQPLEATVSSNADLGPREAWSCARAKASVVGLIRIRLGDPGVVLVLAWPPIRMTRVQPKAFQCRRVTCVWRACGFPPGAQRHAVFSPSCFKARSQASPPLSPHPPTSIPLPPPVRPGPFPQAELPAIRAVPSALPHPLLPPQPPAPSASHQAPSKTQAGAGMLGPRWTVCGPGNLSLCGGHLVLTPLCACIWMCASMALRALGHLLSPRQSPSQSVNTAHVCKQA